MLTAGAPPAAATIERIEGEFGWVITQAYGLTETSPFITICEPRPEHEGLSSRDRCDIKARQGVELVTSGELRVVDQQGSEVPHDGRRSVKSWSGGTSFCRGITRILRRPPR